MYNNQGVRCNTDQPHHIFGSAVSPHADYLQHFKDNFQIKVRSLDEDEMLFDLIGVDASLANALRRILIAEIPTMAIDHVHMIQNSSIIQDEVLAHRVGLIPIKADPAQFEEVSERDDQGKPKLNENNTIVFRLDVSYSSLGPEANCVGNDKEIENAHPTRGVYSRSLQWLPNGDQEEVHGTIAPVHDDILLAKLRPGQTIQFEAHCFKGIGRTHAKWSPVCTASYRLLPQIVLKEDDEEQVNVKVKTSKCPNGVFDLGGGSKRGILHRPLDCAVNSECTAQLGWENRVEMQRNVNHFLFSIESTGVLVPQLLLSQAIQVLSQKCEEVLQAMEGHHEGGQEEMLTGSEDEDD